MMKEKDHMMHEMPMMHGAHEMSRAVDDAGMTHVSGGAAESEPKGVICDRCGKELPFGIVPSYYGGQALCDECFEIARERRVIMK